MGEVRLLFNAMGLVLLFNIWKVASIYEIGVVVLLYNTLRVVVVHNRWEVVSVPPHTEL
jgi:hypothetical protein